VRSRIAARSSSRRRLCYPASVRADRRPSPAIALLAVLVVAAVLRVAAALTMGDVVELHGDESYYVHAARSLAAGAGFPGALRPPGYPAFLAATLVASDGSLRVARVVQAGVAVLGVALVFALVRPRFGTRAATLSALLCALHPTLVFYGHVFWSETVLTTLLLLAFVCLDRFDRERRDGWLLAAGFAFGATVLVRDMLLAFVPVAALWAMLVAGGDAARPALRVRLRRAALLVLPVVACVAPWVVRNQLHFGGGALFVSSNGWYPIAVGNLIPRHRILGMADENRAFVAAYDAQPDELARARFARESALQAIADRQPGWFLHKLVRNTYYLFSTESQLQRFVKGDWLAEGWREVGRRLASAERVFSVAQLALGLLALWLVPGGRMKLLVVALILFHWGVYVVANATNRFRVPLLPFFALYTGPLLLGAWRATRGARPARWRIAGAAATIAAFAAIVVTPLVRRLLMLLLVIPPLLAAGCRSSRTESARPNVVVISIDTLRADHLGAYGYSRPTSPHLDALAASGVLFENAFSPSSWTLPAHASLLSGVSPYRHGAVAASARIRDDVPLLAELLGAQGYHTAAFVNAPFVGRDYGFARGFARFEQRFEQKRRDVAERHRQVLDAVPTLEPPFFLFVHYMDVHTPYRPPKEFNRFARDRRSSAVLKDIGEQSVVELQRAAREGRLHMSEADRDRLIDLYDGEILAMDAKIGELVGALRERFPDMIVVVTSDHGEEFLEHGGFGHGETLYEEVLRVPLIVAGDGVVAGARVREQASLLDVVPTLLERLAIAPATPLAGRSLLPFLRADREAPRDAAGSTGADGPEPLLGLHTASHDGTLSLRGVRVPGRKLMRDDRRGTVELYDLASDPDERRNLAPATRDESLERALAALGSAAPSSAAPAPDPATVEALKALGYL